MVIGSDHQIIPGVIPNAKSQGRELSVKQMLLVSLLFTGCFSELKDCLC